MRSILKIPPVVFSKFSTLLIQFGDSLIAPLKSNYDIFAIIFRFWS